MNVISFSREDRELRNRIKELYDNCAAEKHAENAAKAQIYRSTNGLNTFSKAELTVTRPGNYPKPRHPKVERFPLYARYNLCRAFESGTYQKHINFALIDRQAKSGILVHRPRHPLQVDPTSSIIRMKRVFSTLATKGNKGIIDSKGISSDLSSPYLSRCLPSEEDLGTSKIISARIEPKRGPGRPFGKYTPKKQSSSKTSSTTNSERSDGQTVNPPRENKKRGRKPSAKTQEPKQKRATKTTRTGRSSSSTTAATTTPGSTLVGGGDDDVVIQEKKKTQTQTQTKSKRVRKNANIDRMEDDGEEEEAVVNSNTSEDSMSMFENLEVPEMPTSDLPPIIREGGGESTVDGEELPNVFDISTIVGMRI